MPLRNYCTVTANKAVNPLRIVKIQNQKQKPEHDQNIDKKQNPKSLKF